MARNKALTPPHFICETCGKETTRLRRDVLDIKYNALGKTPFWNCEECYEKKRTERLLKATELEREASSS